MTEIQRSEVDKAVSKLINSKLIFGFLGTIIITVGSIVWTTATYYYNTQAAIKELKTDIANSKETNRMENQNQNNFITNVDSRVNRLETKVFMLPSP